MTLSHERPQRTLSKESDMKLQELFNWTRSYMNPIIVLLFRYFQLWKTCLLAMCHLLWALHFGGRAAMTDWITPRKCLSSLCHLKMFIRIVPAEKDGKILVFSCQCHSDQYIMWENCFWQTNCTKAKLIFLKDEINFETGNQTKQFHKIYVQRQTGKSPYVAQKWK